MEIRGDDDAAVAGATVDSGYRLLFRLGGVAALATVALTFLQVVLGIVWPPPDFAPTAAIAESMLRMVETSPVRAFVTLDGLMVIDYVMLGVVYLALYAALRRRSPSLVTLGVGLALIAITLYFAVNPSITMFALGAQYALAPEGIVPAAQAALAAFEGTAFIVHYIVMGVAGILVSMAMLRGTEFSRATAVAGILQGAMMLVPVTFGTIGLVFALGSLIPFVVWFVLVGIRLGRMASQMGAPAGAS